MKIVRNLVMTCAACPSQWEGTTESGQHVYIRYRWGHLRASVGGREVLSLQYGDDYDGVLSTSKMQEFTASVFTFRED